MMVGARSAESQTTDSLSLIRLSELIQARTAGSTTVRPRKKKSPVSGSTRITGPTRADGESRRSVTVRPPERSSRVRTS